MSIFPTVFPLSANAASQTEGAFTINDANGQITAYSGGSVVNIPEKIADITVTGIAPSVFSTPANKSITSVYIPATVKNIGQGAFGGTSGGYALETVIFAPQSQLASIDVSAFQYCSNLQNIIIPASVTSIEGNAFNGCTALNNVSFEDGSNLTKIGLKAFTGTAITSIIIPDKVTSILGNAFQNCSALTDVTVLSKDVIFNATAFSGCTLTMYGYADSTAETFANANATITFVEIEDNEEPTISTSDLEGVINNAEAAYTQADYTPESWSVFASALAAAKAELANPTSQDAVNAAQVALEAAIGNLIDVDNDDDDDPLPGDYTVSLVASDASVNAGDSFTVAVNIEGNNYANSEIIVSYDADLFTLTTPTGGVIKSVNDGIINIRQLDIHGGLNPFAAGTIVTLAFTAKAVSDTSNGIFSATADIFNGIENDMASATCIGATVSIVKQYTVKFYEKNGSTQIGSDYSIASGDKLSIVPDAVAVENHTFIGWKNEDETYTKDELLDLPIISDMVFVADYVPNEVNVTFIPVGSMTGANKATYNTDYTATINGYNKATNEYEVSYTIGGGASQTAPIADDGKITIPGNTITGDIVITLTTTAIEFSVEVKADYVTGYSLVLVENINGATNVGYTYDGNAMFYVERYNAFAYLVAGSADNAKDLIVASGTTAVSLAETFDVNGSGKVDFADVAVAGYCYAVNTNYVTVAANMNMFLRADVNGDFKVDADDMDLVWDNY